MLWRFWGKISAVNRRRLAFYAGLLLLLVLLGLVSCRLELWVSEPARRLQGPEQEVQLGDSCV